MIEVLVLVALVWFCRRAIVRVVLRMMVFAVGFVFGLEADRPSLITETRSWTITAIFAASFRSR